jgi:predicted ATPase
MRLKSVYISQYKNLRNFDLAFDDNSLIDVFVGKNGTGKSNLFEALIEIFRHLYEYDNDKTELDFNYRISFEIDGKETEISWTSGQFKINGKDRKTIGETPLPDNVLIYYSGHNDTVPQLVEQYKEAFRKRIKAASDEDIRKFIGIGPEYKALLLAVLLMQEDGNKARQFICRKLGIKTVSPEVKLVLQRPFYASSSTFDIEDLETDRYWKPVGITKTFLDRLSSCISQGPGSPVRAEGYFASEDRYILYFDIAQIQQEFSGSQELFRQFDNLKTLEMLKDISIDVTLESGAEASIAHFSDGQLQSVYIYAIIELFKDRNCLTLLDEPDCFLHPEWQFEFLKQVFEITDIAARNNHVLMSSHSAVTLIPHEKKKIKFFDIKDNHANCYDLPKTIAINKLSSDLIKYSEQEQLLSIINAIQIEKKPVLFTEGSTDPIILKDAWYKLFEEEMPFIPFYAFSSTYLKQLLTDNRIHAEMGNLPVFALFDFDKAYDQWNSLNGDIIEGDPFKGMVKKWANGDSYAIMLPVPPNPDIQKQVIKDATTKETYGGESSCEIEHLFYGQAATAAYYQEEPCVGGRKIIFKSDSDKIYFARNVVHTLNKSCFEAFRPMFEFIKSKC